MFNRKLIAVAVACLGIQAAMPAAAEDETSAASA